MRRVVFFALLVMAGCATREAGNPSAAYENLLKLKNKEMRNPGPSEYTFGVFDSVIFENKRFIKSDEDYLRLLTLMQDLDDDYIITTGFLMYNFESSKSREIVAQKAEIIIRGSKWTDKQDYLDAIGRAMRQPRYEIERNR